jgi:hypothetical protein
VGEPGDVATLLVDGQQYVAARGARLSGEAGDLLRLGDVEAEQGVAGEAVGEQPQRPVRRRLTGKSRK